jgi:putative sigma-54 modulation protein
MEITPAMKEFIEEKVTKALSNYSDILREVDVTCSVAGNHGKKSDSAHHKRAQKAEVTVYTHRHGVVRVEDTEDDLYAAVDLVCDKMKRKMVRLKEKAVQRNTWPGRGGTKGGAKIEDQVMQSSVDSLDDMEEITVEDIMMSDSRGDIVREKLLVIEDAMSPEEAVESLEAVGHDFFVFMDSNDGRLKIMYRRASHGYGLIVPSPVSEQ